MGDQQRRGAGEKERSRQAREALAAPVGRSRVTGGQDDPLGTGQFEAHYVLETQQAVILWNDPRWRRQHERRLAKSRDVPREEAVRCECQHARTPEPTGRVEREDLGLRGPRPHIDRLADVGAQRPADGLQFGPSPR